MIASLRVLKSWLRRHPRLRRTANLAYGAVRLDLVVRRLFAERVRRSCYAEYEAGARIVRVSIGGVDCRFHAFSAKNYWHLSTGSGGEYGFAAVLMALVQEGDVVFDLGGGVGMWTVPLAKKVGAAGRVFAFEPDPTSFEALRRNLAENGLLNVECFQAAISAQRGRVSFFLRPDKDTHSIFEATDAPSPTGRQDEILVDAYSLDYLIETEGLPIPKFMKIDIEGAELVAIEGGRKMIPRVGHTFVECHWALKLQGHEDFVEAVEGSFRGIGMTQIRKLSWHHLLVTSDGNPEQD